jgi:stress response protein SCP2
VRRKGGAVALDWKKSGNEESAELGAVGVLEIELEWEQPETGRGLMGRLRGKLDGTDVDVSAILFEGDEAVDYVDPKSHPRALGGAVVHGGDVVRGQGEGGGEKITMRLADIREQDSDITGIALTASCSRGNFSKVAGAVCRIYDGSGGTRVHLGNVRFAVTGEHTGALLGVVRKTPVGWSFTKAKAYGVAGSWRHLAALARGRVG